MTRRITITEIDLNYKNNLLIRDGKIDRYKVKKMCDDGEFNDRNGHFASIKLQCRLARDLRLKFISSKIERTIMWKMQSPNGNKHWLFGEIHYKILLSNLPNNSQLHGAIEQATVFMPEVVNNCDHDSNTRDLTISGQIDSKGKKRKVEIIELDSDIREELEKEWNEDKNQNKDLSLGQVLNKYDTKLKLECAYLDGNLSKFTELLKEFSPDFRSMTDRRNKIWLEKIVEQCDKDERCLVYPGVGHVIEDKNSLVSLLKNKGYTFKRVN